MTPSPAELKRALRRQLRLALARLTAEERRRDSDRICRRLLGQGVWRRATTILLYGPMPSEVDVRDAAHAALAEGKTVALLRFDDERGDYLARQIASWDADVAPGAFGILEPAVRCRLLDMKRLDFVVVPGLGFTADGRRLGRGKGYYDRVLEQVRGFKCGVAFDQQVVEGIPTEPHDVQMDGLLTPTRWYCPGQGEIRN